MHSDQNLEDRLSPADVREIVKMKCLENHVAARTHLNYQKLAISHTPFYIAGGEYKSMEEVYQAPDQLEAC